MRGLQVLLVDDDPDALDLLAYLFELQGAFVKTAQSAAGALKTLTAFAPHVIVSDIGMPVDDGYSLIRSIRTLPEKIKDTPAIALTAFTRAEDCARSLAAGFNRHIAKPVQLEVLIHAVEELTSRLRE